MGFKRKAFDQHKQLRINPLFRQRVVALEIKDKISRQKEKSNFRKMVNQELYSA